MPNPQSFPTRRFRKLLRKSEQLHAEQAQLIQRRQREEKIIKGLEKKSNKRLQQEEKVLREAARRKGEEESAAMALFYGSREAITPELKQIAQIKQKEQEDWGNLAAEHSALRNTVEQELRALVMTGFPKAEFALNELRNHQPLSELVRTVISAAKAHDASLQPSIQPQKEAAPKEPTLEELERLLGSWTIRTQNACRALQIRDRRLRDLYAEGTIQKVPSGRILTNSVRAYLGMSLLPEPGKKLATSGTNRQ